MFDPLIQHYKRLSNIKPSAEIASVFSGSNKRRKRQKSAAGNHSNQNSRNSDTLGRPRRPHSSMVISGYNNSIADYNNNYNGSQLRRGSTNNLNNPIFQQPNSTTIPSQV